MEGASKTKRDKGLTEGLPSPIGHPEAPPCYSFPPAAAFAIVCIGLVSGFGGALLLGRAGVTLLRALELLAEDKVLMKQLEDCTENTDIASVSSGEHFAPHMTSNDHIFNMVISAFVGEFGVFSSAWSFSVGMFAGLSVFDLLVKKHGETAPRKALLLAGPVCLMGATATGYFLGLALHWYLLFTLSLTFNVWYHISLLSGGYAFLIPLLFLAIAEYIPVTLAFQICFFPPMNTPVVVFFRFLMAFFFETKLILLAPLFPVFVFGFLLGENANLQLIIHHIPLMLVITDVFNSARWPIISLTSQTSTTDVVLEGLFIGALTSQLVAVALGMSFFEFYKWGGAGKICVGAVTSGAAVIGVIESVLPVLGPGPTIGALMGVAGAAGVSLAAAVEATVSYGTDVGSDGLVGRLGVTVGAAVGAFLASCSHSGLSSVFMAVCAATIPTGLSLRTLLLYLMRYDRSWKHNLCLGAVVTTFLVLWIHFKGTKVDMLLKVVGMILSFAIGLFIFASLWISRDQIRTQLLSLRR